MTDVPNKAFHFLTVLCPPAEAAQAAELRLRHAPVNVLHGAMLGEMSEALSELAESPAKTLLVSSDWPRIFSAGVSVEDHLPDSVDQMLSKFHGVCRQLFQMPQATIALVRGACLGGALELVSCCDLVVAESGAWFQHPEIDLGCYAPWAAAWYPQWLGAFRSRAILHLAERFDAEKAQELGLVYRVVPEGQGPTALANLASRFNARSTVATSLLKKSLSRASNPFDILPSIESIYRSELAPSHDMREGLTAFLDKRSPKWTDR